MRLADGEALGTEKDNLAIDALVNIGHMVGIEGDDEMKNPTGRYAPSNPPMQNIPIRTPVGAAIKRAFADHYCPPPEVDYSALERRVMAWSAGR